MKLLHKGVKIQCQITIKSNGLHQNSFLKFIRVRIFFQMFMTLNYLKSYSFHKKVLEKITRIFGDELQNKHCLTHKSSV